MIRNCRVFLSTDSGSVGLNLKNASVVINCDLPWNPAKLEQRIARAWRKNQTRPVTVINLISENTIEHRMLGTLAAKQALAEGVLELRGDLKEIKLTSGRQSFLAKLKQLTASLRSWPPPRPAMAKPLPVDRAKAFAERARDLFRGALVRCEERYPPRWPAQRRGRRRRARRALLWQEKLRPLHEDPLRQRPVRPVGHPVNLEVIDRVTDEAINRLIEAGLIARHHPRDPVASSGSVIATSQALSGRWRPPTGRRASRQGQSQIEARRDVWPGRLPRVEARQAGFEAIHAAAHALAVENRLPEPASLKDVLARQPWSLHWGDSLPTLREFMENATSGWQAVGDLLRSAMQPTPAADGVRVEPNSSRSYSRSVGAAKRILMIWDQNNHWPYLLVLQRLSLALAVGLFVGN